MNPIDKLAEMLEAEGIPFERGQESWKSILGESYEEMSRRFGIDKTGEWNHWLLNQIVYWPTPPKQSPYGWKMDAIWQKGSHGAAEGLLETWGDLGVDEVGEPRTMTPEEAFEIIRNDWQSHRDEREATG